jgi:hypothetical protein
MTAAPPPLSYFNASYAPRGPAAITVACVLGIILSATILFALSFAPTPEPPQNRYGVRVDLDTLIRRHSQAVAANLKASAKLDRSP